MCHSQVHEVIGEYNPIPEEGYSTVTVTPAYMPRAEGRNSLEHLAPASLGALLAAEPGSEDEQLLQQLIKASALVGRTSTESRPSLSLHAAAEARTRSADVSSISMESGPSISCVSTASHLPDGSCMQPAAGVSNASPESQRWLVFEVMDTGQLHRVNKQLPCGNQLTRMNDVVHTIHAAMVDIYVMPCQLVPPVPADIKISSLCAGIGIAQDGLKALFKEYVQGTEDEMKKPRSKGGTGLGLSICSKQVCSSWQCQWFVCYFLSGGM